ncbi:MAG: dihydrolipoamide acetyltransferase family protein, partial [Oceanococcaceae bacterium]
RRCRRPHCPPESRSPGERPLASPAVRQHARNLGIELSQVQGSGPAGRIRREDLDAFMHQGSKASTVDHAPRTEVDSVKVIGIRRQIAETMQRTMQRIPHFSFVEEVDVTELDALRQHLNAHRTDGQSKLTVLPFLMQALVRTAPAFPQINANYDDDAGVLHRIAALHIGVATQTDNGLVVPVVRHAETLDIWGMAAALSRLANAARAGKATRAELSGSSITISSLGPLGGIVSTPVINAPEVAIVGVNKMQERPVIRGGMMVPRLVMNLSSSFDHRIVDGWDAAAFIQRIKSLLEHPATLFLP